MVDNNKVVTINLKLLKAMDRKCTVIFLLLSIINAVYQLKLIVMKSNKCRNSRNYMNYNRINVTLKKKNSWI